MEPWELSARERIRDTVARYTWAGDSGRIEELAACFCPDGALQIRGEPAVSGRDAIVARLTSVAATPAAAGLRRIVRHNVTNVRFTLLTPRRAEVASYFTVFTEIGLDHHGRYRDVFTPVGDDWLIAHRLAGTDWSAPNSTMVG